MASTQVHTQAQVGECMNLTAELGLQVVLSQAKAFLGWACPAKAFQKAVPAKAAPSPASTRAWGLREWHLRPTLRPRVLARAWLVTSTRCRRCPCTWWVQRPVDLLALQGLLPAQGLEVATWHDAEPENPWLWCRPSAGPPAAAATQNKARTRYSVRRPQSLTARCRQLLHEPGSLWDP